MDAEDTGNTGSAPAVGAESRPRSSRAPSDLHTVSPGVLREMARTRPWVGLGSICGFLVVATLVFLAPMHLLPDPRHPGTPWMAPVFLAFAAVYAVPSVRLYQYWVALGVLLSTEGAVELERALARQRAFWRSTGHALVLALVYVLLVLLPTLLAVAAASDQAHRETGGRRMQVAGSPGRSCGCPDGEPGRAGRPAPRSSTGADSP